MTYFKDLRGGLHSLDDANFQYLLPAGCVEISDAEAAAIEAANQPVIDPQVEINAAARAYLSETDWYVIRRQETGAEIPADVLKERKAARARIK